MICPLWSGLRIWILFCARVLCNSTSKVVQHLLHMNVEMKHDASLLSLYFLFSTALTAWNWSGLLIALSSIFTMCLASSYVALWWVLLQYGLEHCLDVSRLHTFSSFHSAEVWRLQKIARYLKRREGLTFQMPLVKCFRRRSWISTLGLAFLLLRLSSLGFSSLPNLRFCPGAGGESSLYRARGTYAW